MKLAKTLVAVAAFAGMAAIAQDAETAALQTAEKESWIPSITMNHSVVKGYYDRGILWDTNTGYEFSIDFNDLFIKNLRLSLFARLPMEKANSQDRLYYLTNGGDVVADQKVPLDSVRQDDYDYFGGELGYSYTIKDVKLIGDITLNINYRLQKNADIYSEFKMNYYSKDTNYDWRYTAQGQYLVSFDHISWETIQYGFNNYKRRHEIEQDLSFGVSFDDVPYVVPNASFTINNYAKYYIQIGLKNSLPCTFISEKLTFNNSLDFYYFGKDYIEYSLKGGLGYYDDFFYSYMTYDPETGEQITGIQNPLNDGTSNNEEKTLKGGKENKSIHSKAGFKNAVWRTSLDYAYTDNVTLSVYAMIIQQLQALTEHQDTSYMNIHKSEFVFGATVSYRF